MAAVAAGGQLRNECQQRGGDRNRRTPPQCHTDQPELEASAACISAVAEALDTCQPLGPPGTNVTCWVVPANLGPDALTVALTEPSAVGGETSVTARFSLWLGISGSQMSFRCARLAGNASSSTGAPCF